MPRGRIVIDGLWRCLCPSLDVTALHKALQSPTILPCRPSLARRTLRTSRRTQCKQEHTLAPHHIEERPVNIAKFRVSRENGRAPDDGAYARLMLRAWKRNPNLPQALFTARSPTDEALDAASAPVLADTLRELRMIEGQYHAISKIVHHLVTKKRMKPDAFLYECLIKANVDPKYGSAHVAMQLLKEMEETRIIPTNGVYHALLDVLAIHPDYVLRNKVLRGMKQAWLNPTADGLAAVTLGLLRDGQPEMALEKLEQMKIGHSPVPPWLLDIFLYTFAELDIHEETLMILQHKLRFQDYSISESFWYILLDSFSRDAFYDGVKYIWANRVISGKMSPSDGVLIDVLNVASRNGDSQIVRDAIKILADRGKKLGLHHFEPLLELHTNEHNLRNAFTVLCLMHKAGLQPDSSSTRAIYRLLSNDPRQEDAALSILRDLRLQNHVPIAAFNVLLEFVLNHRGMKHGMDLYRNVRRICSVGPDLTTFKLLLNCCTTHKPMRFLLAEMEVMSIELDEVAYDRVIFVSTLESNYELAFRYLNKMSSGNDVPDTTQRWITQPTAMALISRCLVAEDIRAHGLIKECHRRGMDIDTNIQLLISKIRENREPTVYDQETALEPVAKPPKSERLLETMSG